MRDVPATRHQGTHPRPSIGIQASCTNQSGLMVGLCALLSLQSDARSRLSSPHHRSRDLSISANVPRSPFSAERVSESKTAAGKVSCRRNRLLCSLLPDKHPGTPPCLPLGPLEDCRTARFEPSLGASSGAAKESHPGPSMRGGTERGLVSPAHGGLRSLDAVSGGSSNTHLLLFWCAHRCRAG